MDIAITPNRPDCLGVRGIARDLASSGLGQLKKQPPIKINQKFKQPLKFQLVKKKTKAAQFSEVYILKMFKIKKVLIGSKKKLYL